MININFKFSFRSSVRSIFNFSFLLIALQFSTFSLAAEVKVAHSPLAPKPGEVVVITVQLPREIKQANVKLQTVEPGKYIRKNDPAYQKDWQTTLPLHDDGKDGDAKANDGIFSATVPAEKQKHRWLIRYRIEYQSEAGKQIQLPKDEVCPNYAYWIDAGPAAWKGSREPGNKNWPEMTFSTEFLKTIQSIHLIANKDDVSKSQWDANFHKQKQQGTIIYRGVVYDHIAYSNRGQGSAHLSGKNKWSLKLNKGNEMPFVDHDGVLFADKIDSLAINSAGSTPHLPIHQGISGLDEVLTMRAYRLAGVPTPPATWLQWRVVLDANEVNPKDQYSGDLWGLYLAIGDMKPMLLNEPDGLVVSTQSGVKHVPKNFEDAEKVWTTFQKGMQSKPEEEWWRKNLDLNSYYSFHSISRLLGNVDLRPDGNHGYYRLPDGKWKPIPWDNDMMFVPRHHQPGYIDAIGCFHHESYAIGFRNRAREILDLFAADPSPTGGQIGQFTADLGLVITPKGFKEDWSLLDAALWQQHPRNNQKGRFFVNPNDGAHFGGPWRRTLTTNDFAGFQKYIVDFCTDSRPNKNYAPNDGDQRGYGWGYLAHEAKEDKIPGKPKLSEIAGKPRQYKSSDFTSPANLPMAAVEWRVSKVGQYGQYELTSIWTKETSELTVEIPAEIFKPGQSYRIRCRHRDKTSRCSHWSDAVLFVGK